MHDHDGNSLPPPIPVYPHALPFWHSLLRCVTRSSPPSSLVPSRHEPTRRLDYLPVPPFLAAVGHNTISSTLNHKGVFSVYPSVARNILMRSSVRHYAQAVFSRSATMILDSSHRPSSRTPPSVLCKPLVVRPPNAPPCHQSKTRRFSDFVPSSLPLSHCVPS